VHRWGERRRILRELKTVHRENEKDPSQARRVLPFAHPRAVRTCEHVGMHGKIVLVTDLTPALWVAEALWTWKEKEQRPVRVGSVVPDGFEAYARIFHPARSEGGRVPWAEVAADMGTRLGPETQWWELMGGAGRSKEWKDAEAIDGSLPEGQGLLSGLGKLLEAFTSTPERCWFCLWDGFGKPARPWDTWPARLHTPGRGYTLFRGPLPAIGSFPGSPGTNHPTCGGRTTGRGASLRKLTPTQRSSGGPPLASMRSWTTPGSRRCARPWMLAATSDRILREMRQNRDEPL
jgi:hypothetical protein